MKNCLFCIFITLLLTSCEIDTLSNGKFDGYWHVTQIESIIEGTTTDISEERMFWAVEGLLLQVRYFGTAEEAENYDNRGFYMRFTKTDSDLVLYEPYSNGWHEDWGPDGGDTPLQDITPLEQFGIYNIPEHFTIEELTNSKMVLVSNNVRLYFSKL